MTQAGYIDASDIAAYGYQIDLANNQPLFDKLIVRASRFFDILCGVEPGYFNSIGYPLWQSLHDYLVGDLIVPRTANGHRYEITTAGKSGSSEPSYPTSGGSTVSNGGIVLTEAGTDVIAPTEKVVYGSNGPMLALPPHVGGVVSVIPSAPFVGYYPGLTFIEDSGYLKITDSLGQPQDVGAPYLNTLIWQRSIPFRVMAVWGWAANDPHLDSVEQGTVEMFVTMWRSKDQAWTKAVNLDSNQMMFNPAIPKRVKMIAASFRNARPSISAFV